MSPTKYIFALIAFAAIVLSPFGLSVLFLYQSGELMAPRDVARWLQRSDGVYGTALNSNAREVALSIYNLRKPNIAVLSSSRGTEFRQAFFRERFSCACMIMSNIDEGHQFFDTVANRHIPKVMVLALDYWWFSASDDHTTRPSLDEIGRVLPLSWSSVLAPYRWVNEGKLSIGDFLAVAAGFRNRSNLSDEPKLGIQGIKRSFGTRADGSWAVLGFAATSGKDPVLNQPEIILTHKTGRYAPDQRLDEVRLAKLTSLIEKLQARGSSVVLMLLPIAPPVVALMESSGRYRFIWELRQRLADIGKASGAEYYDFFDGRTVSTSACEFQDPHHGGNALYARMLRTIVASNPRSALGAVVDGPAINRIASEYAGKVVAAIGHERPEFREVDFLGIGCRK